MNTWLHYLISGLIGLAVGMERERSHPQPKALGVRSFVLISLLGAVAGSAENPVLSALLGIFTLGLIALSYWPRSTRHADRGLTTELAAGLIFFVGYASQSAPALSALVGAVVTLVLLSKKRLHHFTRQLRPAELESALFLALGALVVVRLLPDSPLDPWGIFHPRKFGTLVLILGALEFSSYLLAKALGHKAGNLLIGFLGGLVSSTAVLLHSARSAKRTPLAWRPLVAAAVAAQLASLLELVGLVILISFPLGIRLLAPVGGACLVGAIALAGLVRRKDQPPPSLALKSPLEWKEILRLAVLLTAIITSLSLIQVWLGDRGAVILSILTGLFELHGVALANATLRQGDKISIHSAQINIMLAMVASFSSKIALAWGLAGGAFARALTGILLAIAGAMGVIFLALL